MYNNLLQHAIHYYNCYSERNLELCFHVKTEIYKMSYYHYTFDYYILQSAQYGQIPYSFGIQTCITLTAFMKFLQKQYINILAASTSSLCSEDLYGGEGPFEALETVALRDAVMGDNNAFAFFSIHCYSELMLVPYAYTSMKPARYSELVNK